MNLGFKLFVAIAPVAAVIMIVSLVMIYPYRKEPAAKSLNWYLFLVGWLLITNTAELLAPAGFYTLLFAKLEYLAFMFIPIAWISFTLRFTGWITYTNKKVLYVAIIIPSLAFLLVLTNDFHGLLWSQIAYFESGKFSVLRPQYGPLFWVFAIYCWGFTTLGTIVIFASYYSGQKIYHQQSLWILFGAIIPGITNIIYLTKIIPDLSKDFTPIGYALSGGCFLAGIYFHRLFWIMPVARGVILQDLSTGILVVDSNGIIIDHNQKIDSLFDLPVICVGKSTSEYPPLVLLFFNAKYTPGLMLSTIKTGQFQWKDLTFNYSLQSARHWSLGIIITVEDISKQVALQADMDQLKKEFINREKLASIGQLTAGLAHEINNPLGYLKSDVRSLERIIKTKFISPEDHETKEIIEITKGITEGLERIENVIHSLLSFSRQGKTESEYESYNLHSGIDTALEIMRGELRDIAEVHKHYGTIPLLMAQKNEINQVLFNILSNALQAVKERDLVNTNLGLITIRTGVEGSFVICEIENNGTPISAETRVRLFELYFTTKPENWGTGLGLNISKEIIEQKHHGNLMIISTDPVIFRIELPLPCVNG